MSEEEKDKCPLCGQEMDERAIGEKTRIEKLKELYCRYNQCRDAELDRFWKNSVFVWTFLLICFSAYGFLLSRYINNSNS